MFAWRSAARWFLPACPLQVGVVLVMLGCEGQQPEPTSTRTELDQQVSRLREDNEKEITDIRGKWLAAESQLVKMGRELEALARTVGADRDASSARIDLLEAELAIARSEVLALRETRPVAEPAPIEPRERLLRAYEELLCGQRAGLGEPATQIYARWGFETADAWAAAWMEASRSEAFERSASERTARLCP